MSSKESKHSDEDDDSSSDSSTPNEDKNIQPSPQAKDSAPSPKAESESPTNDPSPSSSPPQSSTPSLKHLTPSPSPSPSPSTSPPPPPPKPSRSPPPPPPKPPPPPPPPPSPPLPPPPPPHSPSNSPSSPRPSSRPPSSPPPSPPPPQPRNVDSSTSPVNLRRQPPQPPFHAPPPPDRPSAPPTRGVPKDDSTLGTNENGTSHQVARGGAPTPDTGGSSPPVSSGDSTGKYAGYTLAGIFAVALVALAVALVFAFKRKRTKRSAYATPYMPPSDIQVKTGANRHYYVQQLGVPNFLANNYGSGARSMKHLAVPVDSPQPKNAQIFFSYEMVMEMTNAFSSQNVIGEGGFGFVYKGRLPDGRVVAVKQLKAGSGQGEREFKAEVEIISRVHHRHLVSLVGYCIFEQQRILIYEFVPNGTLHHHLHGIEIPVLDWTKRLKIAVGAAKGLAYLHEDCSQKIIHRDIKSENILLDDAFEAQVADFGLARLADAAKSHVSTRVMGTFGYMAPEYATSGKLSDRSDVFSFGVVLLELVTGRKPVDQTKPLGDESLVEWARPLLPHAIETRDFGELIDPRLEKHFVENEMLKMIEAAAACVRHSAPRRPRMVQVVRALDFGDKTSDLSNGVKYGHSTVYDSGQYDKEISLFRKMANGTFVDSDFDVYGGECNLSRESSRGSQQEWVQHSSSDELEFRAIHGDRSSID